MHIFVTGATGWIGSAVVRELIEGGHSVTGLTRTQEDAAALAHRGATAVIGSLEDRDLLRQAASDADGVIHTAMGSGFGNADKPIRDDVRAIETFGEAYGSNGRPVIVTHGLGALSSAETFTEAARPGIIPGYPRASEQTAFELASRGINASVVRPARAVHGIGERHGFVPLLAGIARTRGVSAYVETGNGLWPACHRRDVGRLYRLAIERGVGGEAYHAVSESVPFHLVAEAIGRQLKLSVKSLPASHAADHFGDLATWVTGTDTVSTLLTRERLGWEPCEIGLLADIDRPEYLENGADRADRP